MNKNGSHLVNDAAMPFIHSLVDLCVGKVGHSSFSPSVHQIANGYPLLLQSNEIDALRARMQATHEQHVGETQAMRTQLDQFKAAAGGEDQRALVVQLRGENKQLKEAMAASQ